MMTYFNKSFLAVAFVGPWLISGVTVALESTIDLEKSDNTVEFLAVGKPSLLKIHGRVTEGKKKESPLKGKLIVGNSMIRGDAKCLLDTLDTGIALRNRHMKEKYLETAKWPYIELNDIKMKLPENFAIKNTSAKNLPFDGILSLHGVKRPITGTASVTHDGDDFRMKAEFMIKVTDYDIDVPSFMGISVTDAVTALVEISAPLQQRKETGPQG